MFFTNLKTENAYLKGSFICASRVCGGDPSSGISATITAVVLPAYAGVILALANEYQKYIGASRVCGGDPKPPIIK